MFLATNWPWGNHRHLTKVARETCLTPSLAKVCKRLWERTQVVRQEENGMTWNWMEVCYVIVYVEWVLMNHNKIIRCLQSCSPITFRLSFEDASLNVDFAGAPGKCEGWCHSYHIRSSGNGANQSIGKKKSRCFLDVRDTCSNTSSKSCTIVQNHNH